jgi:hypothetical protein
VGLYDWVYVKYVCPKCGHEQMGQFQTKDLGCGFNRIDFGDEVSEYHIDFLDICNKCKCVINAYGVINEDESSKKKFLVGIIIMNYSVKCEDKVIRECYIWDAEKQDYVLEMNKAMLMKIEESNVKYRIKHKSSN